MVWMFFVNEETLAQLVGVMIVFLMVLADATKL
jgi:hypothetical protein